MRTASLLNLLCGASLVALSSVAHAVPERVEVPSRSLDGGRRAVVPVLVDAPERVEAVMIDLPAGTGRNIVVERTGSADYGFAARPVARVRESLKAAGIAVVSVAAPSDLERGLTRNWRENPAHVQDISAVVAAILARFPGRRVYLAGYAEAAVSLLHYATRADSGVAGYVLLGGYYATLRQEPVERIGKPVLAIHARTHKCAAASLFEARELAERGRFRMVEAGYPDWEPRPDCTVASQNALHGLDAQYAGVLVQWARDGTAPDAIGTPGVPAAYHEEVRTVSAARLETTVFRPRGSGPFPLVVFNHGDADRDSPSLRKGARLLNFQLASLFADMGFAVAFPQRPGVGRSPGSYRRGFSSADGDSTYKAREHAEPILAAVEDLRRLPYVDRDRIIMAGQSAGGFSTMYVASTNPPWLAAAIDFSGGRSNMSTGVAANAMMVDAFATFGRTTKIPTLWIFAENDSRYPREVILASHKAFVAAGGNAKLLLFPPIEGDGHFVYRVPRLWHDGLKAYLAERGFAVGAGALLAEKTSEDEPR